MLCTQTSHMRGCNFHSVIVLSKHSDTMSEKINNNFFPHHLLCTYIATCVATYAHIYCMPFTLFINSGTNSNRMNAADRAVYYCILYSE